jgi:hypothetical protein
MMMDMSLSLVLNTVTSSASRCCATSLTTMSTSATAARYGPGGAGGRCPTMFGLLMLLPWRRAAVCGAAVPDAVPGPSRRARQSESRKQESDVLNGAAGKDTPQAIL